MDELVRLLKGRRVAVLTGAGCSTASGIPDYRGPNAKPNRRPMQHADFVSNESSRRRYWSRSFLGWPKIRDARPNDAHRALAALEERGVVSGLITQNVDGLHQAAKSRAVIELHGALAHVICLGCKTRSSRADVQSRLKDANSSVTIDTDSIAPDGDVDIGTDEDFVVVDCVRCGGVLMPDVVFFGGSVPRERVDAGYRIVEDAEVLLVVGTSLTVFSGLRFVRRAVARERPVAIINVGPTRADDITTVRIDARAGPTLVALTNALGS